MGLINYMKNTFGSTVSGLKFFWGINTTSGKSMITERLVTVAYTCRKILADNISRMPISVQYSGDDKLIDPTRHNIHYILNTAPNGYTSPQFFWQTVEYHRAKYGNGFARIHRGNDGEVKYLTIIHPDEIEYANIVNGILFYKMFEIDEKIPSDDILHFRTVGEDRIFGISPLFVLANDFQIINNVDDTINNFYKNKASSQFALKSTIGDARSYSVMKKAQDDFKEDYGGPDNAGKVITLPPNTELQNLSSNYTDADLINTFNLKRGDIASAHGIPLYMLSETRGDNAEDSSLIFRNFAIAPIVQIYISELEFKLLTADDKKQGYSIAFDLEKLVEADVVSRAKSITDQVKSGVMTPNEGSRKLGNEKIEGEFGDKHYMQMQYIVLEEYDKYQRTAVDKTAPVPTTPLKPEEDK